MKIQQIRNATLLIEYAGTRLLVDPFLAEKGTYPGFEGTANSHLFNPLVETSQLKKFLCAPFVNFVGKKTTYSLKN